MPRSNAGPRREAQVIPVVAIGASAGGLEAFGELLANLPADTGMAFIFIQHLSRDTKTMLPEILARKTEMRVIEATDGVELAPNHVYVMPGQSDLHMLSGRLRLVPRSEGSVRHLPIDIFMRALASEVGDRGIGVILSGSGADGVLGLKEIKSAGGITFVQDPGTAAQADMPQNAILAGVADFVLSPGEIGWELGRLGRHPYVTRADEKAAPTKEETHENVLRQIFLLLRSKTGVDFSGYKRSTFGRRLARRMLVTRVSDVFEYLDYLRKNPTEIEALYQDVLIMVTEFFREPETFEYLKKEIFPTILEQKGPTESLRLWIVGCSSGEEAYSFAIALLEFLEGRPRVPIQVFGTDVNEKDIDSARAGIYPFTIASQVSAERLSRFFETTEQGYRIRPLVREMCTFARHDLTRDPPFSNLDLISCRNVLIYFDTVLQERVMPIFHYALRKRGVLLLGRSESVGRGQVLFDALDLKHHTFEKKSVPSPLPLNTLNPIVHPVGRRPAPAPRQRLVEVPLDADDVRHQANEVLVQALAPTSMLLDERYEVLHLRGRAGSYLEHPPGRPSFSLFPMLREGLGYELRNALREARDTLLPVVRTGVPMKVDNSRVEVDLRVVPFKSSDGGIYFVVSFYEPDKDTSESAKAAKSGRKTAKMAVSLEEADLLKRELEASQEHLRTVITERDVSTEELRAALEEVQSSNEELQSTNEELETAKEELQSTNEELSTVNDELQTRNLDLTRSQDDLANLLASAAIPMIVLDGDLRIRRFTPGTETLLRLLPSDIGRPISDIKPRIPTEDLDAFLRLVVESPASQTREVKDEDGRWYSMRSRPYVTATRHIEGAVLSFVDVDDLKRGTERLREAKELSDALNQANAEIGSTLDIDEVMRRVMTVASEVMAADSAMILTRSESGWIAGHNSGFSPEMKDVTFIDEQLPHVVAADRSRAPILIDNAASDERIGEAFLSVLPVKSQAVLPLRARDVSLGVLLINYTGAAREFTDAEADFATQLAHSVSSALENARLHAEALRLQQLSVTLTEIMENLAKTSGLREGLPSLLERSARAFGADCAVEAEAEGGHWRILSTWGLPTEILGEVWGSVEAVASLNDGTWPTLILDSDPLERPIDRSFLKAHGISSAYLIPLVRDHSPLGFLLFGFLKEVKAIPEPEKAFLARLGSGLALALENARLFGVEHRLAESLRLRLAPPVPALPRFEFGAATHMATEVERVGGDFYEIWPTKDNRVAVLIGDVTGKGLPAAGLTEAIRTAAKAIVLIDPSPGFVFDTINEIVRTEMSEQRAASALLVLIDPETGAMQLAAAGHPPALVCGENCRLFEDPAAPPLGFGTSPYITHDHMLGPDETLVLYTDGLSEARSAHDVFGEERLLLATARLAGRTAQEVADGLLEEAVRFTGHGLRDDVALVVIRRAGRP